MSPGWKQRFFSTKTCLRKGSESCTPGLKVNFRYLLLEATNVSDCDFVCSISFVSKSHQQHFLITNVPLCEFSSLLVCCLPKKIFTKVT